MSDYGVGGMITNMNNNRNTDRIIQAIGNVNEWKAYAQQLEEKIAKLEVQLKESKDDGWELLIASLYRKSLFQATQLWLQQFNEVPVHPDLIAVGKN
jgi:hypothetical protein